MQINSTGLPVTSSHDGGTIQTRHSPRQHAAAGFRFSAPVGWPAAAEAGTGIRAMPTSEAMLLSCIDPRMVAPVHEYMHRRGLTKKFSQFIIAGRHRAAVQGLAPGRSGTTCPPLSNCTGSAPWW
jgi:hypothetical protein